ncbi:uncharacterized protein SPSK_01304 [Sporothrix schenckii 1099-18]|uniref:Uncharacterized protein n=1 Tax=Sporothrix schenckii 1099-18 TaxID=1397361 RepID=A0A0F2LZN4_SPOSC|nr:uncharacterized protein SPSK_01304 [Sporothrix schenckii 1099-18]KJR81366.1 hypothetical protein SPSK_01304 [Sporothrix schenckii 1099-18]
MALALLGRLPAPRLFHRRGEMTRTGPIADHRRIIRRREGAGSLLSFLALAFLALHDPSVNSSAPAVPKYEVDSDTVSRAFLSCATPVRLAIPLPLPRARPCNMAPPSPGFGVPRPAGPSSS